MRVPLRHPPPTVEPTRHACAYLEALAQACVGVPLGPAARCVAGAAGRGRHGNALQWHLGLEVHDGSPSLDWEGRIEIKLVSVWRQTDGRLACDKLKVCDAGVSPWDKLANVLWVFADRSSRVVIGTRSTHLCGELADSLARAWRLDLHFDRPPLFIESRDTAGASAPAYYLSARWLSELGVLPVPRETIGFGFDAKAWGESRSSHGGRDPLLTVVGPGEREPRCGRCGSPLRVDLGRLLELGHAPAVHGMPIAAPCALHGHLCLLSTRLPSPWACSVEELVEGVEARTSGERLWRLADRVAEPEDHQH